MNENWEELSLFQNRPHTTLEFERQLDKIFQWMSAWDYEKVQKSACAWNL